MKNKICLIGILIFFSLRAFAQKPEVQGDWNQLFSGPAHLSDHDAWISQMKAWRTAEKKRLDYNDAEYNRPAFQWTRQHFIFIQIMAHERYLYDPISGKYTVDRFLNDLKKRYGGIDGVLLWPTYPNIGVDNRNQYDLFAGMPGGLQGVKQLIADFHKRGVKVFLPIMFWDHGTRPINEAMPVALVKELMELGADGLTGDTMHGIPVDYKRVYDSLGYPLVLQPELTIYDYKMLEWNTMSWNYYWKYTRVPGVSIYKWLEPKHQVQVTNRWATDKTDDLQYAFFNGIGYNPWENIWGIWNQVPDRYAAAIRRITSIYRQFPAIWTSKDWEPHIPTLQDGVYASMFPGEGQTIYTFVNRDSTAVSGAQISLPYKEGMQYFDIWNGRKLLPVRGPDGIRLSFDMEARGFGAVLVTGKHKRDKPFKRFLAAMKKAAKQPLNDIPDTWKPLLQQIVAIKKTTGNPSTAGKIPADEMVLIPPAKNYIFESHGVMIEGNELPTAIGTQRPWEQHPSRYQSHTMDIPAFYIDKYPVTNKQFKAFMDATRYQPEDTYNFLKDWHNGTFPAGWDNKPVTWVSLEDARAYTRWAGKRLPHEWEWQYAAQGSNRYIYPWGNEMDSTRMPLPDTSRTMRAPTDVNAFSRGANEYGLMDLIGNVWQWTDEYTDEHTRSAILKGGSYFRAQTSFWYFPQAYQLNKYAKYLLMAPGLDRSGTIGFRCVRDKELVPENDQTGKDSKEKRMGLDISR